MGRPLKPISLSLTTLPHPSPSKFQSFPSSYFLNFDKPLHQNNGICSKISLGFISIDCKRIRGLTTIRKKNVIVASTSDAAAASFLDGSKPEKGSSGSPSVSLSEIIWPSAGAFAAMAILGKIDQILATKGVAMTIAPLGAVCAVLFATPTSPAARKYNIFMAQIGCAATGVLAFSIFGPGWLARGAALAASIAFMISTGSTHPPAASLPLLFIDGAKLHRLNFWYALFPGAAGCIVLCLIQEMVSYLKNNCKF